LKERIDCGAILTFTSFFTSSTRKAFSSLSLVHLMIRLKGFRKTFATRLSEFHQKKLTAKWTFPIAAVRL
jgi:hypothetical protein